MRWVSTLSERPTAADALEECAAAVSKEAAAPPDVAFLFAGAGYGGSCEDLLPALRSRLAPRNILGCAASGVIAAGQEVERKPALSLLCGWLPGVEFRPFHIEQKDLPSPDGPPKAWRELVGIPDRAAQPSFILVSDPYSIDPEELVQGLDFAFPASVKVGGLASAASGPGENTLFLNDRVHRSGAAGLALTGDVVLDAVVAQGCRPIGRAFQVTRCERNLLQELDGEDPITAIQKMFSELPPEERKLARSSLFLGLVVDPLKADPPEYLIRNLIGLDPEKRVLAVGALLRVGQSVRFQVRDAAASTLDLERHLSGYAAQPRSSGPAGALLFSCVGRGQQLFRKANHDSGLFSARFAGVPVGGFFCNGEIGPVEKTTYLHGYTSCFGLFRSAAAAAPALGKKNPQHREVP